MTSEYLSELGDYSSGALKRESAYYKRLVELYDLESCVKWIRTNKYVKVCVQFPESLLIDSVDIAAYIESNIGNKVYILGDTTYGSCCVDEVGANHVNGDCVIHFGHACLSPVTIPTYYVFLKYKLDVDKFLDLVENHPDLPAPIFLLYDVSYTHNLAALKQALNNRPALRKKVCIPELLIEQNTSHPICSQWCFLRSDEYTQHCTATLRRAYCPQPSSSFQSLVYIGQANANLYNFTYVFKDCKMYNYKHGMDSLQEVCKACITKKISYLVERIRNAYNVGIIVATLGVEGYREALEHAKLLCSLSGKKSYFISVGKPTPTKLANFSEMDIFVAISCPESDFGDMKQYMQPIVGLYELDLALNKSRPWVYGITRDFREVIRGVNTATSWTGGQRATITSYDGSYGSFQTGSWSLASISTTSMPRLATAASMKVAALENESVLSKEPETYNYNELMAQMKANRNAQSLIHQMKYLSKEDATRMKAYQITVQKPEKDAFEKHYIPDGRKQEFWNQHLRKQRNTTALDRISPYDQSLLYNRNIPRDAPREYQNREGTIKQKLEEMETLSVELAQLIEFQERMYSRMSTSSGGGSYVEPKVDRNKEEDDDSHTLRHIIPRSVLDQLTHPASTSRASKEWKGLDQRLGEDEPALLKEGRKGGPQTSYNSEPNENQNQKDEK